MNTMKPSLAKARPDLLEEWDYEKNAFSLVWGKNKRMSADIFGVLPSGQRVVVEYDGQYWHDESVDRDMLKTNVLLDAGFVVVRVREGWLDFLPLADKNLLQVPQPAKGNIDSFLVSSIKDFVTGR